MTNIKVDQEILTKYKQMQYDAHDLMYETYNKLIENINPANLQSNPEWQAAKEEYEKTVKNLIQILGENAHCNDVDCDLWGYYSDIYKSENGIRPRHRITLQQVQEYLKNTQEVKQSRQCQI